MCGEVTKRVEDVCRQAGLTIWSSGSLYGWPLVQQGDSSWVGNKSRAYRGEDGLGAVFKVGMPKEWRKSVSLAGDLPGVLVASVASVPAGSLCLSSQLECGNGE